jgi:hypothetical protein
LQSDSSYVHIPTIGTRSGSASLSDKSGKAVANTIYGRRFLAVAIDEAHAFRNTNKLHTAVRALRENTDLLVAMTATPVQTRPSVRDSVYANW